MIQGRPAAVSVWLAALGIALAIWWVTKPPPPDRTELLMEAVEHRQLADWTDDDHHLALQAFLRSCARLEALPLESQVGPDRFDATASDWRRPCERGQGLTQANPAAARQFFEDEFVPTAISDGGKAEGLFTGYYEPHYEGSRERIGRYNVPVYGRPEDLVTADLGAFQAKWEGVHLVGRLEEGKLLPFDTREAIESDGLEDRAEVILWLRSAVDAFFLQIQGSGRIRLSDGSKTRVGYVASNGHPYTAIGKELVARGALAEDGVSMQSIRRWLEANSAKARDLMSVNARYIFFRELIGDGPFGAAQVVLSPGRSLAIDTTLIPLHLPVWLETTWPPGSDRPEGATLRRLMITQDTGSAIRGPVRGDVFWGGGREAEELAGRMSEAGQYFLLLPKALHERLAAAREKTQ